MDKVFVTGATGFVGANVVRTLIDKGFSVSVLARRGSNRKNIDGLNVEIVEGDLLGGAVAAGCRGSRYVFHVAADYRIWVPDPAEMYRSNIEGTQNVIKAAGAAGVERIVHCSSVAAVKVPHDRSRPSTEASEYSGEQEIIGTYKKSKWLSELAVLELVKSGLPVVIVNPAAPIGPFDIKPTPTGRIVVDFLNGRIPAYIETGLNVVHVKDVAEGHYLAAVKGRIGQRYILGGENLTLKSMLDTIAHLTGLPAPRFKTPYSVALAFAAVDTLRAKLTGSEPMAPVDAVKMSRHFMFYDSSKAIGELGLPQTPARTALRDAARWFLENGYVKNRRTREKALAALEAGTRIEAAVE